MSQTYTYEELRGLLKVDAPLLMLDRLTVDSENKISDGLKLVTMNDPVFQGHFPGQPVLPGVLQVAAMAQSAKALLMAAFPGGGMPVVQSFRRVKFRTPVVPGMTFRTHCEVNAVQEDGSIEFQIKNTVDGEVLASSGFVTFQYKDAHWFTPEASQEESPVRPDGASLVSAQEIMKHIPHRYPFMLIDGAYGLGDMCNAIGIKCVTGADSLVRAANPCSFPCYLQIEAGAQLGCAVMLAQPENAGLIGFFMSIDEAVFYRPVLPGDKLTMKITCEPHGKFGVASGEFYVGAALASKASIKFALVPGPNKH